MIKSFIQAIVTVNDGIRCLSNLDEVIYYTLFCRLNRGFLLYCDLHVIFNLKHD